MILARPGDATRTGQHRDDFDYVLHRPALVLSFAVLGWGGSVGGVREAVGVNRY